MLTLRLLRSQAFATVRLEQHVIYNPEKFTLVETLTIVDMGSRSRDDVYLSWASARDIPLTKKQVCADKLMSATIPDIDLSSGLWQIPATTGASREQ